MTPNTASRRRAGLGSLIAVALTLVVAAQPVSALTWGRESRLTASENYRPEILRTGATSAVALWQRGANVYARRTSDGGRTWTVAATVASGIRVSYSAAGAGRAIDLAYVKRVTTSTGGTAYRLFYRRSADAGATWGSPRAITSSTSKIADQDVARHASGQVSIVWTGLTTGNLYMRTSVDGGSQFGPPQLVGRTTNAEPGRTVIYRGDPVVAIGTGVTYVAYTSAPNTASIRSSTNRGASWSAATRLGTTASPEYSLVAAGARAVVAYTASASGVMRATYRSSNDNGANWSSARPIVDLGLGQFSTTPQLTLQGSTLGVVVKFGRPGASPIWYRHSSNYGATWSALSRVSAVHVESSDPEPGGIVILSDRRLAGYNENRGDGNEGLWVRVGQ